MPQLPHTPSQTATPAPPHPTPRLPAPPSPDADEPPPLSNPQFKRHLRRITKTRKQAQKLLKASGGDLLPAGSLSILWSCIFDHLLHASPSDVSDPEYLKSIIANIQKLLASTNNHRALDARLGNADTANGLTAETLQQIEQQLAMM